MKYLSKDRPAFGYTTLLWSKIIFDCFFERVDQTAVYDAEIVERKKSHRLERDLKIGWNSFSRISANKESWRRVRHFDICVEIELNLSTKESWKIKQKKVRPDTVYSSEGRKKGRFRYRDLTKKNAKTVRKAYSNQVRSKQYEKKWAQKVDMHSTHTHMMAPHTEIRDKW